LREGYFCRTIQLMLFQIIFVITVLALLLLILLLFTIKAGFQLQYLRLKARKKEGSVWDVLKFTSGTPVEKKLRWEAFLLFPLLFPIVLDENKKELNDIKRRIKRIHIGIYVTLIALIILAIYSEKIFPAGA